MTGASRSAKTPPNHPERSDDMAKHTQGSMDITTQEKTFAGFLAWTKWTVIVIICLLIFLALVNG